MGTITPIGGPEFAVAKAVVSSVVVGAFLPNALEICGIAPRVGAVSENIGRTGSETRLTELLEDVEN